MALRDIFQEPLFVAKETVMGLPKAASDLGSAVGNFLRPVPTTPQLEQQMQQSLLPSAAKKIKGDLAAKANVVPIGGDRYLGLGGLGGALKRLSTRGVQAVLKRQPPAGLLKEMERFIDYQRLKQIPQEYKESSQYEADVRDAVNKFGVNPNQSNVQLANQFEEILTVANRNPNKGAKLFKTQPLFVKNNGKN